MGKVTTVFNDSGVEFELKQGSANVFCKLVTLEDKKSYAMKVDESATFREYWCAMPKVESNEPRVVFNSDDCHKFSKVRIYKETDKETDKEKFKYGWEGTERRGSWWQGLWPDFLKKKDSPSSSNGHVNKRNQKPPLASSSGG